MRGDGSTLKRIPMRLLNQVQLDKELRGPFRMWLYIREFIGSKFYVNDREERAILKAGGFSNYQIAFYAKVLVRRNFMRRDKKGNLYPYKLSHVCPSERRKSGKLKMTTHRPVEVAAVMDSTNFKKFLRGHPVLIAADIRCRSRRGKKRACCYAANPILGGGNPDYVCQYKGRVLSHKELASLNLCQGVSLSNLCMTTGRSKSTVSRWRKDGQVAGYELYQCYQPINPDFEDMPLYELQMCIVEYGLLKELNPNLLRTVEIDGEKKVMEQVPSQIAVRGELIFYA